MLEHESTLQTVVEGLVEGELVRGGRVDLQRTFHGNLVDVVPERAKLKVLLAADGDPVGVNLVPRIVGGDANRAVVSPGTRLHRLGGSHADFRVPGADLGDHIVHVVSVTLEVHIRSLFGVNGETYTPWEWESYPEVLLVDTIDLDASTLRQSSADILPRTLDRVGGHNVDTICRRKTEVLAIGMTLEHGRIMSPAVTRTRASVRISKSQCYEQEDEGKHDGGVEGVEEGGKGRIVVVDESIPDRRAVLQFMLSFPPLEVMEGHADVEVEGASSALSEGLGTGTNQSVFHSPCDSIL